MSTRNLGLDLWPSGAEQPEVPVNASFQKLDALVRPGGIVQDTQLTAPPSVGAGDIGKTWVVLGTATGAWAGHDDDIALLVAADLWLFLTPEDGWLVKSLAQDAEYEFSGSGGWSEVVNGGGGESNTVTALATSGSVTINCALGDYFTCALSGNVTSISFSNLPGAGKGATKMIRFTQDSTARTVTWPASFKWAGGSPGSVSTGSGAVDVLAISTFDNGTTWYATIAKAFA